MRIYLVGFMGSGKSTYGRALADALGFAFYDLDELVEKAAGDNISAIFENDGEEKFRKLEKEQLRKTKEYENAVIATGGGAACEEGSMEWMNANGTTVYLRVLESQLHARLREDSSVRPLIKDIAEEDLFNWIYQALRNRAYYYQQANIVISPGLLETKELAEKLRMIM
ncbi:MAG: AAA family ATPase [Bacteroidota bacterium]|nr:AAA family ATPase [Bacteroidota bacterium]